MSVFNPWTERSKQTTDLNLITKLNTFIFILFHFVQGAVFIQNLYVRAHLPCEFWCWSSNSLKDSESQRLSLHCIFFLIIFNCFAPKEFFEFPVKTSEKSAIAVKLK